MPLARSDRSTVALCRIVERSTVMADARTMDVGATATKSAISPSTANHRRVRIAMLLFTVLVQLEPPSEEKIPAAALGLNFCA